MPEREDRERTVRITLQLPGSNYVERCSEAKGVVRGENERGASALRSAASHPFPLRI